MTRRATPLGRRIAALTALTLAVALATTMTAPSPAGGAPAPHAEVIHPALTGTATASSSAGPSHGPKQAIDEDPQSSWRPAKGDQNPWLQIDLGELVWLTGIRQSFERTDDWRFQVLGSTDGADWVPVIDRGKGAVGHTFSDGVAGLFRYVRLQGAGAQHPLSSRQLTVSGSSRGANIAEFAKVTASSEADDGPATAAVDGNSGTRWMAADEPGPHWLRVDLGSPALITGVAQHFARYGSWAAVVEGSLDGATWDPLLDASAGARGNRFAAEVDGRYRYLRLTISSTPDGSTASSSRFEVYGFADLALGVEPTGPAAPAHPTSFATDGLDRTSWVAPDSRMPKSLEVDLGGLTQLRQVRQTFHDEDLYAFRIEASADREDWRTVAERPDPERGRTFTFDVDGTYRYVRLVVISGNGRWASSVGFEVLGTPIERDLAPQAGIGSSSNVRPHDPGRAVDGDPDTWWEAATSREPGWLTVDLGRSAQVSRIEQTFAAYDVWNFTLEGSADGEGWRRLARHRGGEPAIRYSDDVAGRFRFLRLRVQGSAEGHLPSSRGLKIIGVGSPVRAPWQRVAPVKRFFPKQYQIRFTEITAQLDELKRQGYAAIELAGFKEGPAAEFGGLGATDNFAVASELGTMADFDELMDTAEQKGIRVVLFDNLGYTHITSPLFKRAVRDFQQGKKTRATEHFVFRNSNEGERWYQYPGTKVWYYGFWGERLPSYNWETQTWRNEATKIIRFWMDKGADGIGLDAPAVYWGFTRELNNRYITDTLANYNASRMIEGIQATYDDTVQVEYQRMVTEWGYNTIQDLSINFWGDPSRNKIVPAIEAGDPSELDLAFTLSRDAVTAVGGIQLEAPGWEADLTDGKPDPDKVVPAGHRLLEIATLSSSGSMFYITNGYHLYRPEEQTIANWEPEQRAQLDRILRAVNTDQSLHPAGGRIQVPTNDDRRFYAYLRTDPTGGVTSLVILNYQKTRQPITVELTGTGVAIGQQPIDLISSKPMPELDSTSYEVNVPGHGYREIGLR